MSTLTIELTNELADRLAAASERQQVSPAQIVQAALDLATNPKYIEGFGPVAEVVLLDSGPLVALMDQREQNHDWARAARSRVLGSALI